MARRDRRIRGKTRVKDRGTRLTQPIRLRLRLALRRRKPGVTKRASELANFRMSKRGRRRQRRKKFPGGVP